MFAHVCALACLAPHTKYGNKRAHASTSTFGRTKHTHSHNRTVGTRGAHSQTHTKPPPPTSTTPLSCRPEVFTERDQKRRTEESSQRAASAREDESVKVSLYVCLLCGGTFYIPMSEIRAHVRAKVCSVALRRGSSTSSTRNVRTHTNTHNMCSMCWLHRESYHKQRSRGRAACEWWKSGVYYPT